MLNEFVYCPRLFYYEWVESVFAHNTDTVEGSLRHGTVDVDTDTLPPPEEVAEGVAGSARSVQLASDDLRLIAKLDLVDVAAGRAIPVDYKKGRPMDADDGPEAWPADRIQIAAQAVILRANGYACDEGVLYYAATKQRVRVRITDEVAADVRRQVDAARALAGAGVIPPPLLDSPKCPRCSLVGICLPDETAVARLRPAEDDTVQPWLIEPARAAAADLPPEVRRLVPSRDDLRPLYVVGQGFSIGKAGETLQIRDRDRKVAQDARLIDVSQVNVFGNVTVSAPAVHALCESEKPIAYFSGGGWFYGLTQGLGIRNAYLRAEQFRRADQPVFCRAVASRITAAKIRNQRTLLQRNHVEPPRPVLERMRALAVAAERAQGLDELLGLEGTAARLYFQHFGGMIKVGNGGVEPLRFEHRNRRPPRDPVNALLSLAYSLLTKDLTIVCTSVGLDPYWGFFHQPRFGRAALALDLMEMFRPLVADSAVLTALNTGMVQANDFVRAGPAVSLTPGGRKGLLRAYEQRMDALVTHPVFDYRVSYRRVLEIQARLLARFICGEIDRYPTFETR
ncbi:MAG: CRISPR-associated endonuclease Cas1 [Acidobacteria bacterium]|nr:CRISPR-associated endonuclease Cas1 [Acidobacteriota bacterium]